MVKGLLFAVLLLCTFAVPTLQWNKTLASDLTLYAFAAYCHFPNVVSWNCHWCKLISAPESIISVSNSTSTIAAYVGYLQEYDAVLISWRGTYNWENWIKNLEWHKIQLPFPKAPSGATITRGFLDDYQSLNERVWAAVSTIVKKHDPEQLYITGHSLGAALSMITLSEVSSTRFDYLPVTLINFGEPRVGNSVFASWIHSRYYSNITRVIHHRDPVPHAPLHSLGFQHIPQEVYYNGKSYQVCSPTNGEDPTCSDSLRLFNPYDHAHYLGWNWLNGEACTD